MSKKRKPISNTVLDIALLTSGMVDVSVFEKCVDAIKSEMDGIKCQFYVLMNGIPAENRKAFEEIVARINNPRIKYSSERLGYPAGANRIIRAGTSPYILFITDDVILHPQSVKNALTRIMSDEKIGLCGFKLMFPEDSTDPGRPAGRIQHIGHGIDIRGEITHPLLGWKPDNPKCNNTREVLSVTGAIFLVKRNAFLKAGGFWEGYGLGYFEDVDLCLTLRQNGWTVWVDTTAEATHYTNATMIKINQPIPMDYNKMLFRQRRANMLINDSWTFW